MTTDEEDVAEEVIELSEALSETAGGYQKRVVLRAAINLLASAICELCSSRDEATTFGQTSVSKSLYRMVDAYWTSNHPN